MSRDNPTLYFLPADVDFVRDVEAGTLFPPTVEVRVRIPKSTYDELVQEEEETAAREGRTPDVQTRMAEVFTSRGPDISTAQQHALLHRWRAFRPAPFGTQGGPADVRYREVVARFIRDLRIFGMPCTAQGVWGSATEALRDAQEARKRR